MITKFEKILIVSMIGLFSVVLGLTSIALSGRCNRAIADDVNEIVFESGATFRANKGSIGIRFKAYMPQSVCEELFIYENEQAIGYKQINYKVGMIIAPKQAFEIPKDNVYYSTNDYLNYITDKTNGLGREKEGVAVDFSFENNNFAKNGKGGYTVKAAIVGINDDNLNYEYQAVVYYTLDGETYSYNTKSDKALLMDLADRVLQAEEDIDPDVIDDIYGIVARTIAKRDASGVVEYNEQTEKYIVSVNDYELEAGKEIAIEDLVKGVDSGYTLTNVTGDITLNSGKLKAMGTGSATLSLSSYNGKIEYTYKISVIIPTGSVYLVTFVLSNTVKDEVYDVTVGEHTEDFTIKVNYGETLGDKLINPTLPANAVKDEIYFKYWYYLKDGKKVKITADTILNSDNFPLSETIVLYPQLYPTWY